MQFQPYFKYKFFFSIGKYQTQMYGSEHHTPYTNVMQFINYLELIVVYKRDKNATSFPIHNICTRNSGLKSDIYNKNTKTNLCQYWIKMFTV